MGVLCSVAWRADDEGARPDYLAVLGTDRVHGAFGKVNLGLHRLTRKLVAIKSINMDFMKEESQKKKIMNEINILKSLRHPNNIKIMETF